MRPRRRTQAQINVVPYIDVMLVLLVIFMVTTPLLQTGLVHLPTAGTQADSTLKTPPLRIDIDAKGGYLLGNGATSAGSKPIARLEEVVSTALERTRRNPEQLVVIAADKDVRYEQVILLMDALKRQSVQRVALMVQTP